jgi:hypothetical protein
VIIGVFLFPVLEGGPEKSGSADAWRRKVRLFCKSTITLRVSQFNRKQLHPKTQVFLKAAEVKAAEEPLANFVPFLRALLPEAFVKLLSIKLTSHPVTFLRRVGSEAAEGNCFYLS